MVSFSVDVSIREVGAKRNNYTLESDIGGEATLAELFAFHKNVLLDVFNTVLKEEQQNGFSLKPRVKVDGSFNKPLFQLNPFGKIQAFNQANTLNIIADIYNILISKSRIVTGNYVHSNAVFFRGELIARNLIELEAWIKGNSDRDFGSGDYFTFINLAPYARRLELAGSSFSTKLGKNVKKNKKGKGARGNIINKPNGTYYRSFLDLRRKYKQSAGGMYFSFTNALQQARVLNSGKVGRSGVPFRTNFLNKDGSIGRPYVYPSIRFYINQAGVQ